jgi:hypothetical protein
VAVRVPPRCGACTGVAQASATATATAAVDHRSQARNDAARQRRERQSGIAALFFFFLPSVPAMIYVML